MSAPLQPPGAEDADERFEMGRLLGKGGMGVVYEAYDRQREQVVAVKVLNRLESAAITRFKREFRSLAKVVHPNLVRLYELLLVDNHWLLTMELIEGQTLLEYIRGVGISSSNTPAAEHTATTGDMRSRTTATPFATTSALEDLSKLRDALGQLVIAVDALHRTGHLHRDLKPSNVLVTPNGRVVLLDFGIIAELGAQELNIVGTPAYMAPEQFVSGSTLTPATDWYAVGCVLYTLAAGTRPFAGTFEQVAHAKQNASPVSLEVLVPGFDPVISEICKNLLQRKPEDRPTAGEVYRALVGRELRHETEVRSALRDSSSFVGRRRQLEVLCAAFQRTKIGGAAAVLIRGRSGMGKSALVRAFLAESRQFHDCLVLEGRCYERESMPYKGVDSVVDMLAQHLSGLPQDEIASLVPKGIASLVRAFSTLGEVPAFLQAGKSAPPCPADPLEIRRRAFAALRMLLQGLAKKQPLVLALDDLQWSDAATEPFLLALANGELPSVMFVGCYRDDAQPNRLLATILAATNVEHLRIGKLSLPVASTLSESLLAKQGAIDLALARQIARESGGIPFLIEELVHYCMGRADTAQFDPNQPLTADRVILARVARLPDVVRTLIELVALSGRPLRRRILARASNCGTSLFEALANLEDANLVSSTGTSDHDLVETYHDRIREAVSASLTPEVAAAHHHALALIMEQGEDASHESALRHFVAAGVMDRAAEHAIKAGDAASNALAFERAVHCYRLALAYHPSADHVELEAKLGEALLNSGRSVEAAEHFLIASKHAVGITSRTLKLRAAAEFMRGGAIDLGTDIAHEVMGNVGIALRSPLRTLAGLLFKRARIRLRGYGFKPRAAEDIPADLLNRIDTSWKAALVLAAVSPIQGIDIQSGTMLLSLKVGERQRVSQALYLEAAFLAFSGTAFKSRADALVERAETVDSNATTEIVGWRAACRANIAYQTRHWNLAQRSAEEAMELILDSCFELQWELSTIRLIHLWSLYYQGQLEEVEKRRREYLRGARERGDIYGSVGLCVGLLGCGLLAQGRTEETRREIAWASKAWTVKGFHIQHLWTAYAESQCDMYDGEPGQAFVRMEAMWKAARREHLLGIQALRVELLHIRGCIALACLSRGTERKQQKRSVARAVERRLRKEDVPGITAFADSISAGLAGLDGNVSLAAHHLRAAAQGFAVADMALFAATAWWTRASVSDERLPDEPSAQVAHEQMRSLGVTEPERFAPLFIPSVTAHAGYLARPSRDR